ncbi:uncharacterized protein LOC143556584 [Bidens hawaiensis]|uniref:uncharacterized protein LOC143556584 n=1 Tax=Bidens hawaiensis TaxID=980011 RepID=UPI00404B96F3
MTHRHVSEALDRTLNDVMTTDPANTSEALFGGKVVVFYGDFYQIFSGVQKSTIRKCVNASINSLYVWSKCKVFKLTKNMRLTVACWSSNVDEIKEFVDWLLDIGEGNVGGPNDEESVVEIPNDLLILNSLGPIEFQDRALLAPLNEVVQEINERMLELFPGEELEYLSSDSLDNSETVSDDFDP